MQIDNQANNDRRQAHQRIERDQHRAAPAKSADGEQGAKRQADQAGDHQGAQADVQRQPDDFEQVRIHAGNERERELKRVGRLLHNFRDSDN